MAEIEIRQTELPNDEVGACGYLEITEPTILSADNVPITNKPYILSFYAKAEEIEKNGGTVTYTREIK